MMHASYKTDLSVGKTSNCENHISVKVCTMLVDKFLHLSCFYAQRIVRGIWVGDF